MFIRISEYSSQRWLSYRKEDDDLESMVAGANEKPTTPSVSSHSKSLSIFSSET